MQRFKKILFVSKPGNNVEPALQRAVQLAQDNDGHLTVIAVIPEIPRTLVNVEKAFLRIQEEQVRSLVTKAAGNNHRVTTRVLTGTPFLEIIREVVQTRHDLVIKAAEGRGGAGGMLFGSTDLHLFRKCPCPVWIIKPTRKTRIARILAAVDPDPAEPANGELNQVILDLAGSLAGQEKAELHVVHAWEMMHESVLRRGRADMRKSQIDRLVRQTRALHKEWLDDLMGKHAFAVSPKYHLVKGEPASAIAAWARKKRVELVVMGTVARTGIPGFFIGNTAEKALGIVDCSVLAVKPKSFRTPVEP